MVDVRIVRAERDDLDDLVPLFDGYRQFYGQRSDLAAARAFLRERIERDESVIYLAYTEPGEAAGFTQLYPSFSSVSLKPLWILNDLYVRYGSWELAQAAYNAGEVKIDKAIRATGSADFWDLRQSKYLRRETKDFVPAIQAAMVIGRDPGQYGFEPGQAVMPEVDRVTVPASTDLRKLAASTC